jgi:anti-sigma factor RsiW
MEELYDTIEQYLRGQLSDSQKEDFERRLNEDAKLREEVEAFRIAREVIEEGIASQLRSDFKVMG